MNDPHLPAGLSSSFLILFRRFTPAAYSDGQDPTDPGVLILSKFAGAAQQLTGALIVNPNDKLEVAEAIRDALQMSHEERVTRWQGMIGPLQDHDVSWWAAAFLRELAAQKARAAAKGT